MSDKGDKDGVFFISGCSGEIWSSSDMRTIYLTSAADFITSVLKIMEIDSHTYIHTELTSI